MTHVTATVADVPAPSQDERLDLLKRISRLFTDPRDAAAAISPLFVEKHRRYFHSHKPLFARRGLRWLQHLSGLVDFAGARVLDVGCGYGVQSMLLAVGGASSVVAIDRSRTKITDLRRWTDYVGTSRVRAVNDEYTAAGTGFELIVARCFLSHLPEDDRFISFCREALVPSGQLWLFDDNNSWSPLRRLGAHVLGWKAELFGADRDEPGFLALRRDLLAERPPHQGGWFDRLRLEVLAHKTRGWTKDEIDALMKSRNESMSRYRPPFPFRHPLTGVCEERLLCPGDLVRRLKGLNFQPVVFPGTRAAGDHENLRSAALARCADVFAREFELVAIRDADDQFEG